MSACDYSVEDLYVADASQTQFPVGYLACANATEADVGVAVACEPCACRETAAASSAGKSVTWYVCVEAQDAATCVASGTPAREYCGDSVISSGSTGESSSRSGSCDGFSVADDSTAGSVARSSSSPSSSSSLSIDVSASLSIDVSPSSSGSSLSPNADAGISSNSGSTSNPSSSSSVSTGSESQAVEEDNVIDNGVVGTVEPAATSATSTQDSTTSTENNIIRPSDNGSADQLDTNNGASSDSTFSGKQLTALVSVACGIAIVAAIAVFVAVRKGRNEAKELGTPVEDYTDDDSAMVTPTIHHLGNARGIHRNTSTSTFSSGRFFGNGVRDSMPMASIVVIGAGDEFHHQSNDAFPHTQQYQQFAGAGQRQSKRSSGGSQGKAMAPTQPNNANESGADLFNRDTSTGPKRTSTASHQLQNSGNSSVEAMASSRSDRIFDSANTRVSFSSSMSSMHYADARDTAPSERMYASEDSLRFSDDGHMASSQNSDVVQAPAIPMPPHTFHKRETVPTSNTIVSFPSSLSSLDSTQYGIRDTAASEHMHGSELDSLLTSSSRIVLSFDMGSSLPSSKGSVA